MSKPRLHRIYAYAVVFYVKSSHIHTCGIYLYYHYLYIHMFAGVPCYALLLIDY